MTDRIQFAVNSWIFGTAPLEEVVPRVARIGFDAIELVGEPDQYDVTHVGRLVADHGLRISSICGMHPGPTPGDLRLLSHPDAAERIRGIDYVKRCVDMTAALGARSVLVVPSLVGQPATLVSREDDIKVATEALAVTGAYAQANDVLITIEPINRYEVGLIFSLADAIAMAEAVDNPCVRVMGDTFHMQIEEADGLPNAFRRAGGYWLQHVHVADNTRQAPGMGTMPWREILRALHDIDYQGLMSLEPLPRGASPYEARQGRIPPAKQDAELEFGLDFLRDSQEQALIAAGRRTVVETA
ncbi:MAG: sugar phosphate isomerase/epimerase [Ardenticatenaceae bacterium]|nr:sugar phosphate isomerase/epimerase [Ardenticatenaceae bacterium]HBY98784.1 sugar phosphate isomerase/epimerase [Chloroflexota bacterium]